MRGKRARYTFVLEFLDGSYVRQASVESPEVPLRAWLQLATEDEFEWATHRVDLLKALVDEVAVPIEGCQNVWCMSGLAGDHLFLIHIIGTESGSTRAKNVAEAQLEQIGRWGWADRWSEP